MLGRLVADLRYQGEGFGAILLRDAVERSLSVSAQIGACAGVDPLDERAAGFYGHYGFSHLRDIARMFAKLV